MLRGNGHVLFLEALYCLWYRIDDNAFFFLDILLELKEERFSQYSFISHGLF